MDSRFWNRSTALAASVGLAALTGCAASEDDPELNAEREAATATTNGIRVVNGLTTISGIRAVNGLTTRNGLTTKNGVTTMNGLRTANGLLASASGVSVDCTGKTAGVDCTGAPDGLLSAAAGLMSTDDGINTARYLVRCALPAAQSLRIKDYTGGLVTLVGELGLSPEWQDGQCDSNCEEKVSACLMALTNVAGNHVNVDLANQGVLGASHHAAFPYQEAVFYGNVFSSPPSLYFAVGKDYEGIVVNEYISLSIVANRICKPFLSFAYGTNSCPYIAVGDANYSVKDPLGVSSNKCTMVDGAASKCKDKANKLWNNPITTYRMDKGAT
ncbi:MAG: hypothetical protein JWN04_2179 [Myxococcaceae bacterium]|nr:hypothetical protein [Myxococcaceae bacterium]